MINATIFWRGYHAGPQWTADVVVQNQEELRELLASLPAPDGCCEPLGKLADGTNVYRRESAHS